MGNVLDEMKYMLKEIQENQLILKNQEFKINEEYVKLLKEECKKDIGRCFKKLKDGNVIEYYRITDIGKSNFNALHGGTSFDEYHYPTLKFEYPYNNSLIPFNESSIFSAAWGKGNKNVFREGIAFEEISQREFNEKFNEVNLLWRNKLNLV